MSCPCGSPQSYDTCCGPFLSGEARPETAEKLMRSRYTAHVRGAIDYIRDTLVPEERENFDPEATRTWSKESKWKGLKIVRTEAGGPDDKKGVVEFIATYERNGNALDHHEVSRFRKSKEGAWLFVDGEAHEHKEGEGHHGHETKGEPVVRAQAKIGRNDPCSCGSGKKFKKCCGLQ